jgi:hypothetical protein
MRIHLAIIGLIFLYNLPVSAQDSYNSEFLAVKKHFADIEVKALAEKFEGLRTSEGRQTGLFKIETTGVSTDPIVKAAEDYLNTLNMREKIRTQFAVDDSEWRRWFNVDNGIYVRQGLSFKEMNESQRTAAMNILKSSLSAKGLNLSLDIMKTDKTLSEISGGAAFLDEELYFITIMGMPSKTEPWGWQIDGHHLVINYFILGDQVVMTPTFLGTEPALTTTGKYAGNKVLQEEQNLGLGFMRSLNAKQQSKATLEMRKPRNNMVAAAHKDNLVLDYQGLNASKLSPAKQSELLQLTDLYVSNMKKGHAKIRMSQVVEHLDETWFSWAGETSDAGVFYYRIHSPVILIEFDHQLPIGTKSINDQSKPTRDHIHVIVRTPNGNDYGKDLLREHLQKHDH